LLARDSVRHRSAMPRDAIGPWPAVLLRHPYRFRDPLTSKWIRARYRVERDAIAARYATWEIIGPAEIRRPLDAPFTPWP
jgi:hypothetical protein